MAAPPTINSQDNLGPLERGIKFSVSSMGPAVIVFLLIMEVFRGGIESMVNTGMATATKDSWDGFDQKPLLFTGAHLLPKALQKLF